MCMHVILFFFSASRYAALLLPHSPGAVNDLSHSAHLAAILHNFLQAKSECRKSMS